MIPRRVLPLSALITFAVAGCSSFDPSVAQEVTVRSRPADATITINGKVMEEKTNTEFVLSRDQDYVIELSKSGYKPSTTRLNHRATGAEAPGAPRFELDNTVIAVSLEADEFASVPGDTDINDIPVHTAPKSDDATFAKAAGEEKETQVPTVIIRKERDEAAIKEASAGLEEARAALAKSEADKSALTARVAELEAALAASREAAAEVSKNKETESSAKLEEARAGLTKADADKATLTARVAELEAALTAADTAKNNAAEAGAEAAAKEKAELTARVETLGNELKQANDALVASREKIAQLETEVEQAKDTAEVAARNNRAAEEKRIAAETAKAEAEKAAAEAAAKAEAESKAAAEVAAKAEAKPAPAKSLTTAEVFARYKTLRAKLAAGEITKPEYDKAVAEIRR